MCEGKGYLVIEGKVERCDECMQYTTDREAASAFAHADLVAFVNAIGPSICFNEWDYKNEQRNGDFTRIEPVHETDLNRFHGFLSDWSGDCRDHLRNQLVLAGCTNTFSRAEYHWGYTNGTQCIEYIEGDLLVYPNVTK